MKYDRHDPFDFAARRHIGPKLSEIDQMLETVGAKSLHALIDETLPPDIRQAEYIDFGASLTERRSLEKLRATANKNRLLVSLIGQGYHGTTMPPAIQRNIFENPAWYTAYSPYQPEISPGPARGLAQLPDPRLRSHRARCGQRLAAR
ncbi:UNVERIFIED_ORG: glycine cleavage system pyridoxal-binding protein P [Methylorubrum zatmanii]|nr:glycine cleavage system pyridoxal-binding protein P [Methylorubrum zatmanii]